MKKYTIITFNEETGHIWTVVKAKSAKDVWRQYVKQTAEEFELDEEEVENDEVVGILEGTPKYYNEKGVLQGDTED